MTTKDNKASFNSEELSERLGLESLTLSARMLGNTVELNNYLKYDGGKGRKTGVALLVNKISNLSIIDIDINKSYKEEQKELIRNNILNKLSDVDGVIKTA